MIVLKLVGLFLLMAGFPYLIGKNLLARTGMYSGYGVRMLTASWLFGWLVTLAMFQVITVPCILQKTSFVLPVMLWGIALLLLSVISFFFLRKRHQLCGVRFPHFTEAEYILVLIMLGLIAFQCWKYVYMQHIDDDDSRFLVNAVDAYERNAMFTVNPVTGEDMGTWTGEQVKDVASPWVLYLAAVAKIVRMHPVILAHTVLPPVFLLFSYAGYALIGRELFRTGKKVLLFVCMVAGINLFFAGTTHTQSVVSLVRIWQGKAMLAAVVIPCFVLLFLRMMNLAKEKKGRQSRKNSMKGTYLVLGVTAVAGSLLTGMGIAFSLLLTAFSGGWCILVNRRWRDLVWCVLACLLPAVYGLLYYFLK